MTGAEANPENAAGTGAPAGGVRDAERWDPDPRRLLINVADLRRRLGQRRTEPIEILLPALTVLGSRTTRSPVLGSVVLESIERGVSATGAVSFRWMGDCRRCLETVDGETEVEIDEIYQVGASEDSDLIDFDGEQIDLVPLVREAVGLSLPLAPLCRAECAGPDPDRYPTLLADDLDAQRPATDPRWAVLDQLDLGSDS
jgi:uncharacterized protein